MTDLIDRQEAIDALIDALAWTWSGTWSEKTAIDAIKNLPSVDAIPVLRCKDCVFSEGFGWSACPMLGVVKLRDDDFCSRGERRTDADE